MAKAHAAAIPDRPPQKRHCTKCCAAAALFVSCTNSAGKYPAFFGRETTHCLWNILRKFCIIELWSIAPRSTGSARMRCCWHASANRSAARKPQTCAPAAASWRWNGTTAAGAQVCGLLGALWLTETGQQQCVGAKTMLRRAINHSSIIQDFGRMFHR